MAVTLESLLGIKYPIIQAPMFLVSNTAMVKEAMNCGIAGCIPALNYRTLEELRVAIRELKEAKPEGGSFGFNLIVNKSNVKYKGQLEVLCEEGCDFIITSLGSPEETIKQAHQVGIKVFCDVVDLKFAKKVEGLGADAVIAVNNEAGGHRGDMDPGALIKIINDNCDIPVISAGGVGTKEDVDEMLVKYTKEYETELIIMRKSKKSFIEKLLTRSHTKTMVSKIDIPLMVIPA